MPYNQCTGSTSPDYSLSHHCSRNPADKHALFCARDQCGSTNVKEICILKYLLIAFWHPNTDGVLTVQPKFTEINTETREVHTHATAVQWRKSESCSTLVKVKGVRCPVSLLSLLSGCMHTTGSLSHRTRASTMPPTTPHAFFFAPCPTQITTPPYLEVLLESWLHLGPSRLSAISVIGSAADSSPVSPCLLFSAHVLTLNCLEKRKRSWGSYEKRK